MLKNHGLSDIVFTVSTHWYCSFLISAPISGPPLIRTLSGEPALCFFKHPRILF